MVLVVLVAIPVASWIWIVLMARDMYGTMGGASAWMMTSVWDWPHTLLLWVMWAVMMTAMMEPATPIAGAVVLAIAGLYQLTPLKRACLRVCRSPLGFMVQRWRGGAAGAFRLGMDHGAHCLGCCWALMLILFAGGVMNLTVILTLTMWALVEKIVPFGERTATASGVVLLAIAVWMGVR